MFLNARGLNLFFIFLCLVSLSFKTEASYREKYKFQHLTIEHGLSQSSANAVIQDSDGFLWFATEDGLNRFDGYKFKVFLPDDSKQNSIPCNFIWSLCMDVKNGYIWLGTNGRGFSCLDPVKETFRNFLPSKTTSDSGYDIVKHIAADADGNIWASSGVNGVFRFSPDSGEYRLFSEKSDDFGSVIPSNNINAVIRDTGGAIWIGSDKGILKYNKEKNRFVNPLTDTEISENTIHVTCLYSSAQDLMYAGTKDQGLLKIDSFKNKAEFLLPVRDSGASQPEINSVCTDSFNIIWIATEYSGLYLKEPQWTGFKNLRNVQGDGSSLSSNRVRRIFEDSSGTVWLTTYGRGLNKYYKSLGFFHNIYSGLSGRYMLNNPMVWSVTRINNELWIGTAGGINIIDPDTGETRLIESVTCNGKEYLCNNIRAIKRMNDGSVWVGTESNGIAVILPDGECLAFYQTEQGNDSSLSDNNIRILYQDKIGGIWAGTKGGGLNLFNKEEKSFKRFLFKRGDKRSLSNNNVNVIYEDSLNNFWVGTWGGGLNLMDRKTSIFTRYQTSDKEGALSHNLVLSVYEDREKRLWVGTSGGGLNLFNRDTGYFSVYNTAHGLANNVIYSILEDKPSLSGASGNLWLSTNRGLSRFDTYTGIFTNFRKEDGLPSNEFNGGAAFVSDDGSMFFGSVNGMTSFAPDEFYEDSFRPKTVISEHYKISQGIKFFSRPEDGAVLHFSPRDYFFSFEFASLDYKSPAKNKYAYIMEGLDEKWNFVNSDKRFVNYNSLKPGRYIFRVKGTNKDGVWSEEIKINIEVHPAFTSTWLFRVLIVILIIILVIFWHKRQLRIKQMMLDNVTDMQKFYTEYKISEREQEIVLLLLRGKSNVEIENELYISIRTVKNHIYNIFKKTGVKSRSELVLMVVRYPHKKKK